MLALRIHANSKAPIAPMAPDSVGVAMPVMMVPSTKKINAAEGIIPNRHFFQSAQPLRVSSFSGAAGR